jgi:hypothetical protein
MCSERTCYLIGRLLFLSIGLGVTLLPAQLSETVRRGDALYHGKISITGKIRGHDESLPAEVVQCANCHESVNNSRFSRVSAPHLDRSLLLDARQRRGGPPSRYDQAAFCKLLKTGVDPAYILVAREMPIYELDENQCADLWSFLIEREPTHVKH